MEKIYIFMQNCLWTRGQSAFGLTVNGADFRLLEKPQFSPNKIDLLRSNGKTFSIVVIQFFSTSAANFLRFFIVPYTNKEIKKKIYFLLYAISLKWLLPFSFAIIDSRQYQ